ncbi:extracellular solute-binding protein [Lapillicoccus sp.]|uniref:sugar ABC transporter substrate-binding protein n=1 Tax=Lapillicoccus sp. TaxID=1909287 RepID=UPI0025DA836C|nr:extracellular solute-binding protein [Lapillicoccus sp.]
MAAITGALALSACSSGGGFNTPAATQAPAGGPVALKMLIASSGDAETNALKAATAAWGKKTGNSVEVTAADNMDQQLGQAFAGGAPPDVFYGADTRIGDFAKAGNLYAYGDQVANEKFLPSLVQTFTYNGKLQCAPKDYSTLALEINTDLWTKAGLTDADIPKDWAALETVATKLTQGTVTGLVIGNDINRGGAFMKQAGGWVISADGKTMTADTPQNLAGLQEIKKMMDAGALKFNTDTTPAAGWGGEAFGKGIAAMTIEGNWIKGGMQKDYPNLKYKVVELPTGPAGKGTLSFSNCWAIAAKSQHQAASVDLVKFLTSTDQQLAFTKAFGPMPSTEDGIAKFKTDYPADAPFAAGGDYGQGAVNAPGMDPVMKAFNSKMATLSKGGDPKAMLADLQKNGTAALAG